MKKLLWALVLGLSLNTSWAVENQQQDIVEDESGLQRSIEPLESNPHKFAELAKSTMDLMGPSHENQQTNDKSTTVLPK